MISETYARAKAEGTRDNHLERANKTSAMARASLLFPPFNVFAFPFPVAYVLRTWCFLPHPIDLHDCKLPPAHVNLIHQVSCPWQFVSDPGSCVVSAHRHVIYCDRWPRRGRFEPCCLAKEGQDTGMCMYEAGAHAGVFDARAHSPTCCYRCGCSTTSLERCVLR